MHYEPDAARQGRRICTCSWLPLLLGALPHVIQVLHDVPYNVRSRTYKSDPAEQRLTQIPCAPKQSTPPSIRVCGTPLRSERTKASGKLFSTQRNHFTCKLQIHMQTADHTIIHCRSSIGSLSDSASATRYSWRKACA